MLKQIVTTFTAQEKKINFYFNIKVAQCLESLALGDKSSNFAMVLRLIPIKKKKYFHAYSQCNNRDV